MHEIPEPTPVTEPKPIPPRGHWLVRTARALLIEHRLPTSVATALDRLAIQSGFPYKTVVVSDPEGGLGPARFRVRKQSSDPFFVAEVFAERVYSPPGYEICESDVIIDVGANIGSFAIFAARRARRSRVIAIEPTHESFSLLKRNIKHNRLENISVERAAISDATGPVTMHLSDTGTGHHSVDTALAGPSSHTETVPGLTMADIFSKYNIDICNVLKLDCEGAEFPILESLSPMLAARIQRIALEYHTKSTPSKREQSDALARRLLDLGFTIDSYTDVQNTNRGMLFARQA